MKEILYRVWAKRMNYSQEQGGFVFSWEMCDVHTLHIGKKKVIVSTKHGNQSLPIGDDCIVMMFTGLFDVTGTRIFEGDLVEFEMEVDGEWSTYEPAAVVYRDDLGMFTLDEDGNPLSHYRNFRVVGHIYEHLKKSV